MGAEIKYISKIEIKGLWGKFDLEWNLQPDVNVLSGINGSGKSTILNCVATILNNGLFNKNGHSRQIDELAKCIKYCRISYGIGGFLSYEYANKTDKSQIEKLKKEFEKDKKEDGFEIFNQAHDYYLNVKQVKYLIGLDDFFEVNLISTFDNEFKPAEDINKISDDNAKTELDWEIYHLQKRYLKYKLSTAQKTIEAINKGISNGKLLEIQANQDRFSDIIDTLFEETHKKLNRKEDEISFLLGEEKISAYQLSSGEKQLLVILLTVLVQDNKNAILFMDEPEISLHFDWQKKLIGYIRELNPNVQIILATHSPAIIIEGWMDKVANVSDIIKLA